MIRAYNSGMSETKWLGLIKSELPALPNERSCQTLPRKQKMRIMVLLEEKKRKHSEVRG